MSTTFVLATVDLQLAAQWESQVPPGRAVVRLFAGGEQPVIPAGVSTVVVLDAGCDPDLPAALTKRPTVFVGEPGSQPFEQARLAGRARIYLGYEESASRLGEFLPLIEEIAAKESMLSLLVEKHRRPEIPTGSRSPFRNGGHHDDTDLWDFFEGAVESIDSRDRLLLEFRRATRHLLRASHAVFFLREADGFRADRGTSFFPLDDGLVVYLERHPAVIDGQNWDAPVDPVAELAVRNRLGMWGARLLVPVHDNGRLLGLIALGVRVDGQPYEESDRNRAVGLARLLRHLLAWSVQLGTLQNVVSQSALGAKYLPRTLVLGPDEPAPRQAPLVVRDLVGRVRRSREGARVLAAEGQPFRASAGLVTETGGVWAVWEEVSGELHDAAERRRSDRLRLLHELALTLAHEVGNPLVSLSAFRQTPDEFGVPPKLLPVLKGDITKLELLGERIGLMHALHELTPAPVDIRDVVKAVGEARGLSVETGPEPVMLHAVVRLLEMAVGALVDSVTENRLGIDAGRLSMQLRSTGSGKEATALLSLQGRHLELEGVLPEPTPGAIPNQGRLGVFLAKEIIRLHHGEIHAGPGMEGTEILISLRAW
jgi:hypothetical protein